MASIEPVPFIEGWVNACKYPDYAYPYHVREVEGLICLVTVEQRADWRGYMDGVHVYIDLLATPRTVAKEDLRVKAYTLIPTVGYHRNDFLVMARACLSLYLPKIEVYDVS